MSKVEKEFLREFIELYRSFPCLWKIKSREYSNRNIKSHAYEILTAKLKTVDPEATRDSVIKKINSLRTTYRKEMKKVLDSERSGAGEEDIYVPHLWYYELMNFIRDQEIPRKTLSNITTSNIQESDSETTIIEQSESPDISSPDTPPCSSVSQTPSMSSKRSRKLVNKCDEVLEVIGKRLKSSSTSISDKFSDIGKVWAAKLRDLPSQQAVHAEKLINDVFYEAQLGNLNRNFTLTQNATPPSCTTQPTGQIFSNFN